MSVPNDFPIVQQVYATGRYNLATHDGQAAFVDAVVLALHAKDAKWGHLKKHPGQTQIHGHGEDSALYLSDTPGQSCAVDFISGAGTAGARPGWIVDTPRYSASDWLDPTTHSVKPVEPPKPVKPPYNGDAYYNRVSAVLYADYAAAGRPLDPDCGCWFGRVDYDIYVQGMTPEQSIQKHRPEWRAALGL